MSLRHKIDTISEIETLNSRAGQHFFDSDTLRFFGSRISDKVIRHRYFVTTEKGPRDESPRRASVRLIRDDGSTETVGEFQAFTAPAAAFKALEKALAAGVEVRNDPYPDAKEPQAWGQFNWRAYVGELAVGSRTTKADAERIAEEMQRPCYCWRAQEAGEIDAFLAGYTQCAVWSSTDPDTETPLDDKYSAADIDEHTLAEMRLDCAAFLRANYEELIRLGELTGRDMGSHGHDFWLTRNGHGTGYWDRYFEAEPADRDEAEKIGKRLTAASKQGERYLIPNGDKLGAM
jgi:hypothetical protein